MSAGPTASGVPWLLWQTTLAAWIEGLGLPVVWARQGKNPPQRAKPYALLDLLSVSAVGEDVKGYLYNAIGPTFTGTLAGTRELALSIQVVTDAVGGIVDTATAWGDEILASVNRDPVSEAFRQAGLAFTRSGLVLDISALEQSQFVSRVNIDLVFQGAFYTSNAFVAVPILRVIGEGDVEGDSVPEINFDVTG